MWVADYLTRVQSLVFCGFRNNLNGEFDAEWYLSVLQPNLLWLLSTWGPV